MSDKTIQPGLFLPHGSPTLPISGHPAADFLRGLGKELPRPDAIVIISAHWETRGLKITTSPELETIYDFRGFPKELYEIVYPAKTKETLVSTVIETLAVSGFKVEKDENRGLDHGAWVPLHLVYPEADIPVVQLSLDMNLSPEQLIELGKALSPLRGQNILVIGSGGTVHNLRNRMEEGSEPPEWASRFDNWLDSKLSAGDLKGLSEFKTDAPDYQMAHPTPEHLLPLLITAGTGNQPPQKINSGFSLGTVGMSAWSFG
ncbi:MAG: DODA-type extradiol aromatic ring-opening family dioxygenase [Methyloligellaceae bacterium]